LLAILRLDGAQLADAFVDLQQLGAECLEAAEAIHLALGLADLGWIGERVLDRLAVDLARQAHERAMAGVQIAGAGAVGLAAAAELGMHGTGPEVAQLGNLEDDLRAALFECRQGVWHRGPSECSIYTQTCAAQPAILGLIHRNIAHSICMIASRLDNVDSCSYNWMR